MTGSDGYLEAIIKESHKLEFSNYRIAGVPFGSTDPLREMHRAVPICGSSSIIMRNRNIPATPSMDFKFIVKVFMLIHIRRHDKTFKR
jgi:hypothetical protein